MADNIYYCDGCGGVLEWDPNAQKLKCPNCGNVQEMVNDTSKIIEHRLTLDARRMMKATEKESQTMECQGCGARIEVAGYDTAAKCPYCGSSYVLAKKQEDVLTPDGVVPFKLDKNGVNQKFRAWMKGRWLAPGSLKNLYQGAGFTGIYVPYWTFDADCDCPYTAEGGEHYEEHYKDSNGNDCTRTKTRWYPTHGHLHHFFDDVQTAASTRFKGGLLSGLEPYDLSALSSYDSGYISGYLSENYSIGLEDGHKSARLEMEGALRKMATNEVLRRYDECRDVRIMPIYRDETYKYALVPVYSTTYQFKDKTYAVVINGQNGKVCGEYPKSPFKIVLIIIVILLALLGLYFASNQGSVDTSMQEQQPVAVATATDDAQAHVCEMVFDHTADMVLEYEDIIITVDNIKKTET